MKFRPIYIAIILLLIVVVFFGSCTGSTYIPYMRTTHFDHAYPYEGMTNVMPPGISYPENLENRVAPNNEPSSNPLFSWLNSLTGNAEKTNSVAKVEGFALHPSPLNEPNFIDRFGKTPSDKCCFGRSMGLSRDGGPLCFNDDDLKLLTTRGGNATGGDSVIGQE